MTSSNPTSSLATLDDCTRESAALFEAWRSGDDAAAWRFRWQHPEFRGRPVAEVRTADLQLADAQLVIAREQEFESWNRLAGFIETLARDADVRRFEAAADAIVTGDLETLRSRLREEPELIRARSTRRHGATLLHYIAANSVEQVRQKTPPNAVEVADMLLAAGAEVDALAEAYGTRCTTMSLLVSSAHPAGAGLQTALAERLAAAGATLVTSDPQSRSPILTALAFGYLDTARALARRTPPTDDLAIAAGLGLIDEAIRLLATADPLRRQIALALAAQHGHADVVQRLLDAGEDPDRFNPEGFHAHSTPLHQAALAGHREVVQLLVERGARLDIRDTINEGTPHGWAVHGGHREIAESLRAREGAQVWPGGAAAP